MCYQWHSAYIEIEKNNKPCWKDKGAYVLTHLPDDTGISNQNYRTMSILEYVKQQYTDLRSQNG